VHPAGLGDFSGLRGTAVQKLILFSTGIVALTDTVETKIGGGGLTKVIFNLKFNAFMKVYFFKSENCFECEA